MFDIFNYENGIHSDCAKERYVHQDIVVTPFFTKEYCDVIVQFCKRNSDQFQITGDTKNDAYSNHSLYFDQISNIVYRKYADHCKNIIKPMIDDVFIWKGTYNGVFPPFINRFTDKTQNDMALHNETSSVSLVVKLNDDFEGGDLVFPRQNFKTTDIPVGYGMFFPGNVTHPHYVEKMWGGERYTLVGFSLPPPWEADNIIRFM